ncbi:hypothetical protein SAMN05192559_104101 [Halobacillus karajensis]|uniref:phage tail assembly chaperone G n=1 Tax=Halobacillus karajensis TaxID=195088 RepID=UPI00045C843C|nr:hypothetical protein [Halobacillus karajensis]CDQ17941.1 hypothetical protein BN982_00181 [Halobacillus karajensis]SEH78491.1 hypothetical protein SAMN05192559_104101 [Halobacillus karajensis]
MANLKRQMIELVKEVKDEGEVVTEKFLTPAFLHFSVVYEAMDLAEEVFESSNNSLKEEKEKIDKALIFIADRLYNKQFTKEELFNGLHGPNAIATIQEQIIFAANGVQSDETKKFLEKKN